MGFDSRRVPELGSIAGLAESWPHDKSLELYRRLCLIRNFELRTRQAAIEKQVKCLIYLALGQEAVAAGVSMAGRGAWVLGQHRGHSIYLAFGGRPERLVDELLGLPSGCCGGMGGSPPIHDIERRIVGHSGLIGDQVPIAVGVAMGAPGEKVVTFFGDGAAEEDYVLAALGHAATRKLPVLFVCEDNDLSVLTPTVVRRSWSIAEVARGFGLQAVDIADDPWLTAHWAEVMLASGMPGLINVRTCRSVWHAGTGSDGPPQWDRLALTAAKMHELGLGAEACAAEAETLEFVDRLWNARLQMPSAK